MSKKSDLSNKVFIEKEITLKEKPKIMATDNLPKIKAVVPMEVKTFDVVKIDGELIDYICANGVTLKDNVITIELYNDKITVQSLEYNTETEELELAAFTSENNEETTYFSTLRRKLFMNDYIARYQGLYNKVNGVKLMNDDIERLAELLKS
jgi:hypothetical protein